MGYGGGTSSGMSVIKRNKYLLSNRKAQRDGMIKLKSTYSNKRNLKKFSEEEVAKAKLQIERRNDIERRRNKRMWYIKLILTTILLIFIFWLLFI